MTDQQIKFRVHDAETNEVVGYEWVEDDGWKCRQSHWADKKDYCSGVLKYINGIRRQFINLKDKKGVEIYFEDSCTAIDPLAKSPDRLVGGVVKGIGEMVVLSTDDGALNISKLRSLEVIPAPVGEKDDQ